MEKNPNDAVESLKNRLEEQLNRMKNLTLEEDRLKLENDSYEELAQETSKELGIQKQTLKKTRFEIYDRRDKFCESVYKKIAEIEKGLEVPVEESPEKLALKEELQEFGRKIQNLRKLNETVNLEMIVIKGKLSEAKEEQRLVQEIKSEQEKVKQRIAELRAEVQKLEIDIATRETRKRSREHTLIYPSPKRFIADPIPPSNSPNLSDDDEPPNFRHPNEIVDLTESKSNHDKSPQESGPEPEPKEISKDSTPMTKPKFVFKRPVKKLPFAEKSNSNDLNQPGTSKD